MKDTTRTSLLDIHSKLTSSIDLAANVNLDKNGDPILETHLRHRIADLSQKINKLFSSIDSIVVRALVRINMFLFDLKEARKLPRR